MVGLAVMEGEMEIGAAAGQAAATEVGMGVGMEVTRTLGIGTMEAETKMVGTTEGVLCYNCNQFGDISRECNAPRQTSHHGGGGGGGRTFQEGASSFGTSNKPTAATGLSKDLEESLKMVCLYTNRKIEKQEKREAKMREAEERRKREEAEKALKEEKNRLEIAKQKAKDDKEAKWEWKMEQLLAKHKQTLREEFKVMFKKRLRNAIVSQRAVKGKGKMESSEDEEEEEMEDRLEKRKRQPAVSCMINPPEESPSKVGKASTSVHRGAPEEPSPRLGVPRRRSRVDGERERTYPYVDSPLWEGAPSADEYTTTVAFRKAIQKFLGKKLKPTIEEMCREVGVVYRGRPEAVDELVEIRVMYFSIDGNQPPAVAPRQTTPRQRGGGVVIREVRETLRGLSPDPPADVPAQGGNDSRNNGSVE
ncbi:hypothetical protein CBR_g64883 [Chara braunii]|uniref:CCHC-type domain-containing protein n=1 Tax=Chara braunii TaxID=69332 RepID=A0A388K9B1_CHABU|nr:hypothetical protein CBR_g64883 [Chara braunii]|eukprot:GBG66611.1 hypothetical protein CBR_g64883 [Chara braunii]